MNVLLVIRCGKNFEWILCLFFYLIRVIFGFKGYKLLVYWCFVFCGLYLFRSGFGVCSCLLDFLGLLMVL